MTDELKPFEREERYIVIKRKHLDERDEETLREFLTDREIPIATCAVVESDWPEYETVWRMIEDRVTDRPQPAADGLVERLRRADRDYGAPICSVAARALTTRDQQIAALRQTLLSMIDWCCERGSDDQPLPTECQPEHVAQAMTILDRGAAGDMEEITPRAAENCEKLAAGPSEGNRQIAALRAENERLLDHISEQVSHAENRIQDGKEMGASVWRIALEDIVRENRAALNQGADHG